MFLTYLYNAITIPLRASFDLYRLNTTAEETTPYLVAVWLVVDHLFDLLYVMDIVLIQSHLGFLRNGVLQVSVVQHTCIWTHTCTVHVQYIHVHVLQR